MDLIGLLIVLVVLGLVYWLVMTYLPLPPGVKKVITVVAVLILCIYLLSWAGIGHITLPHHA